jgi:hypothetical protein
MLLLAKSASDIVAINESVRSATRKRQRDTKKVGSIGGAVSMRMANGIWNALKLSNSVQFP